MPKAVTTFLGGCLSYMLCVRFCDGKLPGTITFDYGVTLLSGNACEGGLFTGFFSKVRSKCAKKKVVTEAAENRQRAKQTVENAIVNVAIAVMTVAVLAHVVEASHVATESVLYVARHYAVALRNSFLFYFVIFFVPTIRKHLK